MGRKVTQIVRTDGLKLLFEDGSWVCYRFRGPSRWFGFTPKLAATTNWQN